MVYVKMVNGVFKWCLCSCCCVCFMLKVAKVKSNKPTQDLLMQRLCCKKDFYQSYVKTSARHRAF